MHKIGDKKKQIQNKVDFIVTLCDSRNPFKIAELLGIRCKFVEMKGVKAFSLKSEQDGNGVIFIKNDIGSFSQRILCAHELGHLILHEEENNLFSSNEYNKEKEAEANYFVTLLLPSIMLVNPMELSDSELNEYIHDKVELCKDLELSYNT